MSIPERTPTPQGVLGRSLHFVFAALVVGGPLAWILAPSWSVAVALLVACGLLGAWRGDAFLRDVAGSGWWAAVRGLFLLRGR